MLHQGSEQEKRPLLCSFSLVVSLLYTRASLRGKKFSSTKKNYEVSRTLRFSYDFSVRNKPAQSNTISSPCSNSFHFKLEIVILAETFYLMYFECLLSLVYCPHGGSCTLNRAFWSATRMSLAETTPCPSLQYRRIDDFIGQRILSHIFSILRLEKSYRATSMPTRLLASLTTANRKLLC